MKEYYGMRWHWIFNYTSKNVGYCILKTLCLIVGLPIYAVMFLVEMVLTAINMMFSWIPILSVVVLVICKALMYVTGSTFYICILTDLKAFKKASQQQLEYEVMDAVEEMLSGNEPDSEAQTESVETSETEKNGENE